MFFTNHLRTQESRRRRDAGRSPRRTGLLDRVTWVASLVILVLWWCGTGLVSAQQPAGEAPASAPPAAEEPANTAPTPKAFQPVAPAAPADSPTQPAASPADGGPPATSTDNAPTAEAGQPAPPAEPQLRAFERTPFDRIVLTEKAAEQSEKRVYEVERMDLPNRKLPPNPRPFDKLKVRFLDNPNETYEIRFSDIERVEFFEQIILNEAQTRIDASHPEEAFDHYQYLDQYHPDFPGVAEAIAKYLYRDAGALAKQGDFDAALAVLWELYARDSQYPGLARALGSTTGRLIRNRLTERNYPEARRLLRALKERYPEDENVSKWSQFLAGEAEQRLQAARAELAASHPALAQSLLTDALRTWPELATARTLLSEESRRYPCVFVGVTAAASVPLPALAYDDWPTRRARRLVSRRLLELANYNQNGEGGVYVCPVGEVENSDLGRRLVIRLARNIPRTAEGDLLNGHDVARELLQLADRRRPGFRPDWAELLTSVTVRDLFQVEVELRRSHVRPDAMLAVDLAPWYASPDLAQGAPVGPYEVADPSAAAVRYRLRSNYFAAGPQQPREITEVHLPDSREALRALEDGRVMLIDRVNPWEVATVSEMSGVTVAPYGVPTVHCLVPNLKKPFLDQRAFRRALLYGIHREGILKNRLLGGREDPSSLVLSGPFPTGYAYNSKLETRPYQPQLALTLFGLVRFSMAKQQAAEKAQEAVAAVDASPASQTPGEPPPLPPFVLAHPAHELARRACQDIQHHLKVVGLDVELREVSSAVAWQDRDEYDLIYAELPVWEPIVDARRLLGNDGLAGQASAYMERALRTLDAATDWRTARELLLRIHQLAAEELTLLPLWQLTDYYAFRSELQGIGTRPVLLYQNIEQWQVAPWLPPDGG